MIELIYIKAVYSMNVFERQRLRLDILKKICEAYNYNIGNTFANSNAIFELFPDIDKEEVLSELLYLREKGYLKFDMILILKPTPMNIQLEHRAIDLVEKVSTGIPTVEYEQDFSRTVLNQFSQINNSQIVINSPNIQIMITQTESIELLDYLDELVKKNQNNAILQGLFENTKNEIKQGKATKEYIRGIGSVLANIGISLASNLLTPVIGGLLGIKL
jgi:hypothetical protein